MLEIIEIESWNEYLEITTSSDFVSWGFRGQSNSDWSVQSTLTRCLKDFNINPDAWAHQEERIVRIFKRKAHHYLKNTPSEDDIVQWLSIMQHHGAPTRLIDFTWSPLIAAYFALNRATQPAAVWAICPAGFDYKKKVKLNDGSEIEPKKLWLNSMEIYKNHFLSGDGSFVVQGEPQVMNDRLIAQAGTFVIPSRLDKPLEELLLNYPNPRKAIVKFVINTEKIRNEAMTYFRITNINESTLFPGIDGMARSIAYELEHHWAYNPKTMEKYSGYDTPPYGLPKKITN